MPLQNWECLIINDGSTDDSYKKAVTFSEKDPRVKVFDKINGGSASARNVGLSHAVGEYIQFLDADDLLHPLKISTQIAYMQKSDSQVSFVDFRFFCNNDDIVFVEPIDEWDYIKGKVFLKKLLLRWGVNYTIPIHAFLYRTDFIRQSKLFFDESIRYREDWNFHIKIAERCKTVLHIPWVAAYYRRGGSVKTKTWVHSSIGNFNFIRWKIWRLASYEQRFYFLLRLSKEFWFLLSRSVKYHFRGMKEVILNLFSHLSARDAFLYICGILLLPLTLFSFALRSIKIYLFQKK